MTTTDLIDIFRPRLTNEEQDIVYELKAQAMRNTLVQNAKLKNELDMVDKVVDLRQAYIRKQRDNSSLSRVNLVKLMRKYEKENVEGELAS